MRCTIYDIENKKTDRLDGERRYILDITRKEIDIYLEEIKNSIRKNNYRIERNSKRQENINLFLDYVIDEKKAKDILFVVFPSNRGGYNVYAVPKEAGSFENRKSFPKEWAGLRDEKLQKITGVNSAAFCHIACFICTAKTKDDAIKLANLAIENEKGE